MAVDINSSEYLEESQEQTRFPNDFLTRSPTPCPLEQNENEFLLVTTPSPSDPLISREESIRRTRNTAGYGSTTPSPPSSPPRSTAGGVYSDNESIRCACHEKAVDKTSRKARIKLVLACIIALVFVVGEIAG